LDLKPENLLLGADFKLKICDFDSAFRVDKDNYITTRGTASFRAPELKSESVGTDSTAYAADVFSAGVILFVLAIKMLPYNEKTPYKGKDLMDILHKDPS